LMSWPGMLSGASVEPMTGQLGCWVMVNEMIFGAEGAAVCVPVSVAVAVVPVVAGALAGAEVGTDGETVGACPDRPPAPVSLADFEQAPSANAAATTPSAAHVRITDIRMGTIVDHDNGYRT
jgi:hypothetical protein